MIPKSFSKTWLRAQYETFKYARILRKKSDDELLLCVDHERNLRAWCSQRSYYLAALRRECRHRGIPYIQ